VGLLVLVLLLAAGCESTSSTTLTTGPPASGAGTTSGTAGTTEPPPTTPGTGGPAPTATSGSGGQGTQSARLSPREGSFVICRQCHAFFDPPGKPRPALGDKFSHERHVRDYQTACEACHFAPTHTETGIRRPTMAKCFECHGQQAEAKAPGACGTCHPPGFPTIPSWHTPEFYKGGHALTVEQMGIEECFVCHEGDRESFCRGCHGLEMPHPEGWGRTAEGAPGAHVAAAYAQGRDCIKCHQNREQPPGNCWGGECHGQ